MYKLLRQRNFALLWFGGLISLVGDWVLIVALPFYVYERSGSTLASATMVTAGLLPRLMFGSIAGVFVDRWNRKTIMVVTSLAQGLVLLPLLAMQYIDSLWIVYGVTFIQSTFAIFFGPAENALLPKLVVEEDLLAANWLNALNNNLARLIGPPIGGAILALKELNGVVIFDSVTFLAAAIMLLAIQVPSAALVVMEESDENDERSSWSKFWLEWRQGIDYVRRSRVVIVLFICTVFLSFGGVMMDPLHAPFILDVVKAGAEIFGILAAVQAVGGLVGSLVAGRFVSKLSPALLFGWAEIVLGLVLFLRFNIPTLPMVFAMTLLTGLPASLGLGALNTLFQKNVPNSHLGRISGTLNTTIGFLSIFGVLGIAGILGNRLGIVPVLNIATAVTLLVGVAALLFLQTEKGEAQLSIRDDDGVDGNHVLE